MPRKSKPGEPKRKPSGQPQYTEKLGADICKHIAGGLALKEVCDLDAMPSRTTVYKWLAQHALFAHMYARAREERADLVADEIIAIADSEPDPNKARVRIDARKWWAAKVNPKAYGDKVQHTGDGGGDLQHQHSVEIHIVDHRPVDQD